MDDMDDVDGMDRLATWTGGNSGGKMGAMGRSGKKPAFIALKTGRRVRALRLNAGTNTGPHTRTLGVGQSMAPLLLPGDRAELKKISGPPALGAVVTFEKAGPLITHRVIKVQGGSFFARGDNSPAVEGPLPFSCIVGEVAAFWRDGERHELKGRRGRILGLARNRAMAALRQISARHPRLRRLVEVEILSSPPIRILYGFLLERLLGPVEVIEETNPLQKLSLVLRAGELPAEKYLRWLEEKIARDELFVFKACFLRRKIFAGHSALVEIDTRRLGRVGFDFGVTVQFGFRGAGVGMKLLAEREKKARRRGHDLLIVQIRPDNTRSLGLFEKFGYSPVAGAEVKKWPAALRAFMRPEMVVVSKSLSRRRPV